MSTDFIFMLTTNDQTVGNALVAAQEAIAVGVTHIGFKDVGVSLPVLKEVSQVLQDAQVTSYLEVVSLDAKSEQRSAEMALELQVDYLLGGTRPELIAPIVKDHPLKYYPFPGKVEGHPSRLMGTITEIAGHARELSKLEGVDGLDLLAYRFAGDVPRLIQRVNQASVKPLIVAGSICDQERIEVIKKAKVQGFTVGTAVFENRFDFPKNGLAGQLGAIMEALNL
jgi:hypothetical protein